MTGADTKIYLLPGDSMQYTSPDGGKTLNAIRSFTLAGIVSASEIRYFISPACRLDLDQVHVRQDGKDLNIVKLSSRNNNVVTGVITVEGELDMSKTYTVAIDGYGEIAAVPTDIFDSAAFVRDYTYDGDDLGAVIRGESTVFKVWAPTASSVKLNLFKDGGEGEAYETVDMTRAEKGVWTATAACGHGTYYTYTVTTAVGAQEAVDPYAKAVGVNGNRGMVIDLASTDPEGFRDGKYYDQIDTYGDAVIWEVHVRDFSNTLAASRYPGKYLAFTETGLTNASGVPAGMDYLKQLGVTHVHLQPVYDYATVDESSAAPQFNWGYDPKNYNAPEGSYATDPYHGEVRVNEFKQMVQSLHENGLGVVMDVVYNHTYALDSWLNRIVPYYYYRFNYDGAASNGSGCGNETASNRAMFRKYMVDSVAYWAKEYQIDGFRFDLMALTTCRPCRPLNRPCTKSTQGPDLRRGLDGRNLRPAGQLPGQPAEYPPGEAHRGRHWRCRRVQRCHPGRPEGQRIRRQGSGLRQRQAHQDQRQQGDLRHPGRRKNGRRELVREGCHGGELYLLPRQQHPVG
jgi:pullulanase